MQKRGSVREHAKFFEEQARLVHTERHPVRRSHTEKPAASTLSNVPRRETLLGGLPVDPRDRMRGARPERRDSGEKLQSTIRKTDNFS